MKGLSVSPAMPDVGAVIRSLLGVLAVAVVALQWSGSTAGIAAAGASAIAGAVALQDSPRGQLRLVLCVSVAMGVAAFFAAAAEPYAVLFVVLVAAWGFASGLTWAVSANTGLVAAAAMALLVVTPPADPPWPEAVVAGGLALAGGLGQAVLMLAWPRRRRRTQKAALARAYHSLAKDARALATDPAGAVDGQPLMWLKEAFTLTDAQAARRPLAYRSWYGLPDRIAVTVTAVAGKVAARPECTEVLEAAADVLDAVAAPSPLARRSAGYALGAFDATAAAVTGPEATPVQRLSEQLREAVALRYGEVTPPSDPPELRRPGLPGEARDVLARIRAHLTWESPVLRHALRLSTAAAAGALIARFADLGHGYWIPLTVVMVLRPETAHTYTRCVGRVAGNAVGILAAGAVILALHPTGLLAAAFAALFLAVTYAVSGFGYMALSAALAATIVMLVDIGGAADVSTVSDRLLATLIGGALAVLAHVVLPDHADIRLRQRAGELLKTEIDYAATVIRAYAHEIDKPAEALSAAWERAYRARAAFEAAAGAHADNDPAFRRWLRAYRTALNVVTASCSALETGIPPRQPKWSKEFVTALDDYVHVLSGDPATPGAAWAADMDLLTTATERVRTALPPFDAATARVLVGELGTINAQLSTLSTGAARLPDNA
jgi:uncharacterized membrane protein YccC